MRAAFWSSERAEQWKGDDKWTLQWIPDFTLDGALPVANDPVRYNQLALTYPPGVYEIMARILFIDQWREEDDQTAMEWNMDRRGQDYTSYIPQQPDPRYCREACLRDSICKAWTYVKPIGGNAARCWLKRGTPERRKNPCCVSGVMNQMALEVNRAGSDYRYFDMMKSSPTACEDACATDSQCKAWTYVRPGVRGPFARCWLKNTVPPPTQGAQCCVSGVKLHP